MFACDTDVPPPSDLPIVQAVQTTLEKLGVKLYDLIVKGRDPKNWEACNVLPDHSVQKFASIDGDVRPLTYDG